MGTEKSEPLNTESSEAKKVEDDWAKKLFRGDLSQPPKEHKLGEEIFICDLEYYRTTVKEEMEVILWPEYLWNWWWVQFFAFFGIVLPAAKVKG